MHPQVQTRCQNSDTVNWSQSPVPAPSSKEEGGKVSVLPLGTRKQIHFALDFSLAQAVPLS